MSAADDRLMVDRCISRQPGAWRQFVDRFAPTVRALARRYLKMHGAFVDESEIDDVTQDVFLALTRRNYHLMNNYDPTYAVTTYLGVITRTEVHRTLRKRRGHTGRLDDVDIPAAADESSARLQAEGAERADALEQALAEIPVRDAEILRLRFLQERDYKTIARALRIPEASVGQTLFRAKKRLLEKLSFLTPLLTLFLS
ncbi:MAG: sigma-70 family RNA polymerase sigma factor [Planctomycetota bacterium]